MNSKIAVRFAVVAFTAAFASNALAQDRIDAKPGTGADAPAAATEIAPVTPETVNDAVLTDLLIVPPVVEPLAAADEAVDPDPVVDAEAERAIQHPNPAIVRLQILLDRAGTSPGVIDGYDGENVQKGVMAFELMQGLTADGKIDPDMLAALDTTEPTIGQYTVTQEDVDAIVDTIPSDYAEKAKRDFLGYESVAEQLAERFHMHIDLLQTLNPGAGFTVGEEIFVAVFGDARTGEVALIEADKRLRQVRAYDAAGVLLAAYPATIGSEENQSPSGSHVVEVVVRMPNYTYNPEINFQQGENTEVLTIPPGPNGPVGTVWIDLSEPTYGIHGTPEPALIDKVGSHGCVRLTNWDAEELADMVEPGVAVEFLD